MYRIAKIYQDVNLIEPIQKFELISEIDLFCLATVFSGGVASSEDPGWQTSKTFLNPPSQFFSPDFSEIAS